MNSLKLIMTLTFLFAGLGSRAQSRPLLYDYDDVIAHANAECDSSMKTGYLHEMAIKYGIRGEYVMDVTVFEKGKVLSVFAVSSNATDVKQQNLVKDIIRQMQFGFKLQKGKNYKLQHTFKFE